jgi:hypothetical protein
VGSAVHLKANGWQLNYRTWQLVKTGMVSLNGEPRGSKIQINGKDYSQALPAKIRYLLPDYYDITVSNDKYQSWQQTIQVQSGKASIYPYITLFLANPEDVTVPESVSKEKIQEDYLKQSQDLKISNEEIYWNDKFITRFSQKVLGAITYSDNNHIVFQQNDEIRVIDIDGSNNKLLFKLNSFQPTPFSITSNGKTIYYLDQDKISGKSIR